MSNQPHSPGFVMQPGAQQPAYPQYQPTIQQSQAYPPPQQYQPYPPAQQQQHIHQPPAYQHQPFPTPIQHQPAIGGNQAAQWYMSSNFENFLRNSSMFNVKQKVELLEVLVGWETENQYSVKDQFGNKIFYVGEETGCLSRQCLGKMRPLTLNIKDVNGVDVMRIDRPLDCTCCCGLFCGDSMTVYSANGQIIGSVFEEFHIFQPTLSIKDAGGNVRLKIEGPVCPMSICGGSVVFKLLALDGRQIGAISKEYGGLVRELFTDADQFNITFPPDLDPSIKAVCLGALFLIDYQYFESDSGGQGGRRLFG